MCVSAVIGIASLATGVVGSMTAADAQRKQAQASLDQSYYDAAMQEMQAEDIKRKSIDDANLILRQAAVVRSSQTAQQAVSGMVLGEGSAQTMLDDTTKLSTADALVTLYDGADGFVTGNNQARNMRTAGQNNADALYQQSQATLLSGFSSAISSYNTLKTNGAFTKKVIK